MHTTKTRSCPIASGIALPVMIFSGALVLLSVLLFSRGGHCAPAIPTGRQFQQPDGTTFSARLWGDERAHGWETLNGYSIVKDPKTNYWCYAQMDPTTKGLIPGNTVSDQGSIKGTAKHLRPLDTTNQRSFSNEGQRTYTRGIQRSPVVGTGHLPVMMVNFGDTDTAFTSDDFEQELFGTGNQSMKDYYEEVSYGAFSITSGSSGVTGWYTAANSHHYYGRNDASGYDQYAAQLVIETVAAADAAIDFSEYDTDGDCYADVVVIIHQGSGEEAGGPATDIWSHRWNLRSAAYYGDGSGVYTTDDVATCGQIKVNDYVIQPETLYDEIQTVGVFAHEYGHVLGLPDLYDTDGSSSGIGNWGLMASGTWNGVQQWGDSPAHLSAWSKYTMGWIDPVVVSSELSNESIDPASATGDAYQFFPFNQTDSKEYFLVENRQRLGFDAGLPGTGLAIWYIDERKASYRNADNTDECLPHLDCSDTHYRVSLVQADGYWDLEYGFNRGDQGDLFPGRFQNRAFNRSSDPDSLLYDGTSSQVSITDIIQSNPTVTATMALVCTITPTVSTGGHISPGGSTVIYPGDTLTFTLTPQDGYQLGAVYVDGQSVGAVSEYTFSNIQSDHDIRADFTSNGSISQSGGANSGGGGGGCFITISSTSFTSALFNHWSR